MYRPHHGAGRSGSHLAVSALCVSRTMLDGMVHHTRSRHDLDGMGVLRHPSKQQQQFVQHAVRSPPVVVGTGLGNVAIVAGWFCLGAIHLESLDRNTSSTTRHLRRTTLAVNCVGPFWFESESTPQQQPLSTVSLSSRGDCVSGAGAAVWTLVLLRVSVSGFHSTEKVFVSRLRNDNHQGESSLACLEGLCRRKKKDRRRVDSIVAAQR